MKCLNCGYSLLEGSTSCPYCGTTFAQAQSEESSKEIPIRPSEGTSGTIPGEIPREPNSCSQTMNHMAPPNGKPIYQKSYKKMRQKYCKTCGAPINPATKKCSVCQRQYTRVNTKVFFIVLAALLVLSIGLNGAQYILQGVSRQKANETIDSQANKIKSLEDEAIALKNSMEIQKETIDSYKEKADSFDSISEALNTENLGYASENFNASEKIIVLHKNETNRKFTLTTNWDGGGEVSVYYSSRCATVSFDNDSWFLSTPMTVNPLKAGATTVTFSNTANNETFKILIFVMDE